MSAGEVVAIVCSLVGTLLLATFLDCLCSIEEPQEAANAATTSRRRRAPPSNRDKVVVPRQQPAPVTTVEMAARTKEPLVCTYLRAHGWPVATCAVCLAELTDGVNVRVLPVCVNYFHASCVGEWLLATRAQNLPALPCSSCNKLFSKLV